jgi:haloacetate dehalogenase
VLTDLDPGRHLEPLEPMTLLPDFTHERVQAGDVALEVAVAGTGPPVVLLHGFPQTHYRKAFADPATIHAV